MIEPLKDTDPFPFGKNKDLGLTMQEVSASYLDWLRDQSWISKWPQVKAYIEDPLTTRAIDKELKEQGDI